ncbi:MAG: valine--tRNA ligase [Candidatus Paceibacterota bacterium]
MIKTMIEEKKAKLDKPYNPQATEKVIYEHWEKSGFFNPDHLPARHQKPFTIIMPPPNANGSLHVGHAVFVTIEDLIIRYRRLQGDKTLWLPGADHAGFETQIVYEKKLEKEGRSRFKLEPADLRQEILDFTLGHKKFMENQLRLLGASCDWSREKFTLDPEIVKIVYQTFKQLADDGLVYRGDRSVNWCVKHQTSLSELETARREQTDKLYYLKYGPVTVATVRPETIFGDTAIAVNPQDKRYKDLIGQTVTVKNPLGEMSLPVIGDETVEMDFGTGALKITPAHDANDFAIGRQHNLPTVEVIDQYGKMNDRTGKYQGLSVLAAREQVVADLTAMNLIEKTEDYRHAVAVCYKCERILEPRIMPQWFIKTKPLAEKAIKAIQSDKITFTPENYKKIVLHWLVNIQDWNISRQIVWGIPIPAKLCAACRDGFVDLDDKISNCPKCGGAVTPDPDTFDTWFSSGQWPFAVLDYPDGNDYRQFYPTNVMETAGEIIFFWVARMIMLGLYRTDQVPFTQVYLHGLVTDAKGQKMSKSKGNVMSPIDLAERFGTDALRLALIIGNTPGLNTSLSENKIKAYQHFANKLWNISRFIVANTDGLKRNDDFTAYTEADQKLITERQELLKTVTDELDRFRFHLAGEKLYHYVWHRLADEIIEDSKQIFQAGNRPEEKSRQQFLINTLADLLICLHPFMPFITEELWSILDEDELLMITPWPKPNLA